MNRLNQLSFRVKISVLVFLTTFTFFMGFILLEDLLILRELIQKTEGWDGSRRLIRLVFAFCFSTLTAVITAFSFNIFYASLRNLIHFIQSWREDGSREDIQITRNDEIGSLIRSLQIALYQEDERSEKKARKAIFQEKYYLTNHIQKHITTLPLKRIPGLDISLFPKNSRNPAQDYIQLVRTDQGCIGIIAGFDAAGVRENSFKASIHSIFRFIHNLPNKDGNGIFKSIAESLDNDSVGLLNLSLFHLESQTGEINYYIWQDCPILIWSEAGVRELDKSPGKNLPDKPDLNESFHSQLEENEWLILLSDRILKTIHLTGSQFAKELNRRVFEVENVNAKNSREITLAIANHVSKRYGKKALDKLGLICIKRSN
jgi:Arg-Lys translocation region protein phosphatase